VDNAAHLERILLNVDPLDEQLDGPPVDPTALVRACFCCYSKGVDGSSALSSDDDETHA
jgi:hypothetical protein